MNKILDNRPEKTMVKVFGVGGLNLLNLRHLAKVSIKFF